VEDNLGIPNNLAARAGPHGACGHARRRRVEMRIRKRIPMGAGLGGGSSDAAAVLLALPVLAGRRWNCRNCAAWRSSSAATFRFFLLGGRAVGIGRGSELFPLPDEPPRAGLLVVPAVHVSTSEGIPPAKPPLTSESQQNKIFSFQSQTWSRGGREPACNDFEAVVFQQHRGLAVLKKRLIGAGASLAMMTGAAPGYSGYLTLAKRPLSRSNHWARWEGCTEFRWSAASATAPCGGGRSRSIPLKQHGRRKAGT